MQLTLDATEVKRLLDLLTLATEPQINAAKIVDMILAYLAGVIERNQNAELALYLSAAEVKSLKYVLQVRMMDRFLSDQSARDLNGIFEQLAGYPHIRFAAEK